jgi:hypothetical protein
MVSTVLASEVSTISTVWGVRVESVFITELIRAENRELRFNIGSQ